MATITTSFAPAAQMFPFDMDQLGGSSYGQYTAAPRGRVCFRVADGVIAAKGAGDVGFITCDCELPLGYAYIAEYIYCSIQCTADTGDADHYSNIGLLSYRLGDGQSTRFNQLISQGLFTDFTDSQKVWIPERLFPLPLFNDQGNTPNVDVEIIDDDGVNATVAGTFSVLACFMQFDIEQAYNLGINFPTPVQVR